MNPTLLSQIASLASPVPGVAGAQTCYWRAGAKSLELHTRRSPVSRVAALACGAALHQAQIAFAANGFSGVVRAGQPGDDLFVRVHVIDDNTARFLDAMAHIPARENAQCLALVTATDSPRDWVNAGQALSAALLTTRLPDLSANVDDVLEVPGRRALVRSFVTPAGQPQILLVLGPRAPLR